LSADEKDLEEALDDVGEKARRLEEELDPDEALDVLEEAVSAVEDLGKRLEDAGS
jgi:exonuclease VII small subunit